MPQDEPDQPVIKIVGPCKSGKSTLATRLRELGYNARSCAQEHSDVPDMWCRIVPADWLIYLDVSLEEIRQRAPQTSWDTQVLRRQQVRLQHARAHCDLYIETDSLSEIEVVEHTRLFLQAQLGEQKGS